MLLQIDFIGDADAWNVGALVAHLGVPVSQIGVGHFARHIEHHDADVRSEIIRRVQLVKRLLTRCVPNVCPNNPINTRLDIITDATNERNCYLPTLKV